MEPAQRALAWLFAGGVGLVADSVGGLGFLSQTVSLPLWALMLVFALPMEAVVGIVMRAARQKAPGTDTNNQDAQP